MDCRTSGWCWEQIMLSFCWQGSAIYFSVCFQHCGALGDSFNCSLKWYSPLNHIPLHALARFKDKNSPGLQRDTNKNCPPTLSAGIVWKQVGGLFIITIYPCLTLCGLSTTRSLPPHYIVTMTGAGDRWPGPQNLRLFGKLCCMIVSCILEPNSHQQCLFVL